MLLNLFFFSDDHRRVVLSQIGDNVNTDYINACYVDVSLS